MQTVVTLTVMKDPIRQFYSVIADNDTIGRQYDNNETQLKIVRPEDGSLDDLSLSINFQANYSELLPSINLNLSNTYSLSSIYTRGNYLTLQLVFTDSSTGRVLNTNKLRFNITSSIESSNDGNLPFTIQDKLQIDKNSEFIENLKKGQVVINGGNSTTETTQ